MADTMGLGLDQAQIADAINRQKLGTQRQKNEMMRLGTSDPNSFAMNNSSQISQAQQPQEYWGAGRKEIPVGTDPNLITGLGGATANLGGQDFYYSPYDVSKASYYDPSKGQDLGNGTYNMVDSNGNSLGTGYKSLQDTIADMYKKNNPITASTWWADSGTPNPDQQIDPNTQQIVSRQASAWDSGDYYQQVLQTLQHGYDFRGNHYNTVTDANNAENSIIKSLYAGDATKDWETLGQLLNGSSTPTNVAEWRGGGNNIADPITGLNTLYGSKPIIYDGKLLGYQQEGNPTPVNNNWNDQHSETHWTGLFGNQKETTNTWDVGVSQMGRQYNDPNWWQNNVRATQDGSYTMTGDLAKNSPGWSNVDRYQRNKGSSSSKTGLFEGLYNSLEPLSQIFRYKDIAPIATVAGNVLGAIFAGGVPIGSLVSAADNESAGRHDAASNALGSAALSYVGGQLAPTVDTGYGATANAAANGAIYSGAASLLQGKGLSDSALAALYGGAGGAAGAYVGDATKSLSGGLSGFLSGAASGAIKGLQDPQHMLESALTSGVGRGLGSVFNGTNVDPEKTKQNMSIGNTISTLAKLAAKGKM